MLAPSLGEPLPSGHDPGTAGPLAGRSTQAMIAPAFAHASLADSTAYRLDSTSKAMTRPESERLHRPRSESRGGMTNGSALAPLDQPSACPEALKSGPLSRGWHKGGKPGDATWGGRPP